MTTEHEVPTSLSLFEEKPGPVAIPDRLYFRIGDVADLAGVKPYVLRYWETEFPMISPQKSASGHRVYRRTDVETVLLIKHLLYTERYSIEGARKRIRELKREGEFKSFREAKLAEGAEPTVAHAIEADRETLAQMQSLAREVKSLARSSISELFAC